jgi:hypothetical protein
VERAHGFSIETTIHSEGGESMCKQFLTAFVALSVSIGCGNADFAPLYPTAPSDPSLAHGLARGPGGKLPTCSGVSDCVAGPVACTGEDDTASVGPTVMTDYSSGVSSDGRGPYVQGTDGVRYSVVLYVAVLHLDQQKKSVKNPRKYTVNLNSPVPGGGGVPLGIITNGNDVNIEIQWYTAGNARQNLHNIPIGQTVTAEQIDVSFHVNGRFHVLQMGPQAYGHCHATQTQVRGTGTSSGTIYRASATKWVIDLPAGSVGRLFDLYNTTQYAVDKGLYFTQLHYEIGS